MKSLLVGLRSAVLFLLILLLFGLLLETKESKTEKPLFINLIDNSASMLNYQDSLSVKSNITSYQSQLQENYGERFEIVDYYLGDDISLDKLSFDGQITDLNIGFQKIFDQYYNRNIGGICLLSDGNFNKGPNPSYTAKKISLTPIFSLGVGDTLFKKDQLIKSVSSNQIAFLGNDFPIEIDIEATKLKNGKSKLQIINDGEVVVEKAISYNEEDVSFQHHSFQLKANKKGFVNYKVQLLPIDGESSTENNVSSFYIEVLDGYNKLLFLTNKPHPDITAVKQVLETDEKLDVTVKLIEDWDGSLSGYQMLLLYGLTNNKSSELVSKIESSKIPTLYFIDNKTTRNDSEKYSIGLSLPSNNQLDEVQGYIRSEFQLFECSDHLKNLLSVSPPIHVKFGKVSIRGGNVLASQRIGKVQKEDPIIYFGKNRAGKFGVIVGEGLWRWKLSEYGRTGANRGFNDLIQQTSQYLLVKDNKEPLRVVLPKRFTTKEKVNIEAEFYNESMELIVSPDISLDLEDEEGKQYAHEFGKASTDYKLQLGHLKEGAYSWVAKTTHNGRKYTKKGVFVVEVVNVEKLTSRSDFGILKKISDQSDGSFYKLSDYKNLIKEIGNRKDIVTVAYDESSYSELIELIWLFGLIVLLLSAEWLIRRYSGSY